MIVVLLLALGARLLVIQSLLRELSIQVPLLDAQYYMETATGLARGLGWPPGPHFMAPAYPFVLSLIFRFAPATVSSVQWAQLVLGLATVLIVHRAAYRQNPAAGWAAGILYALCGPAIAYENQPLMEPLLSTCTALLVLVFGGAAAPGVIAGLVAGLVIGIATSCRPTYVLLLPLLWFVAARRQDTIVRWRGPLLVSTLGFLVIAAPPTIRNIEQSGRFSFITTSGGLNLYIGNHPGASGIYSLPAGLFLENDPTGARAASREAARPLNQDEASRYFAAKALRFFADRPIEAARLILRKARYVLGPQEVPQIESFDQLKRDHPVMRPFALVGFSLLFVFGLIGWSRGKWSGRTRVVSIAVVATGALSQLIFFSTGRYRAALLPVFAIAAGVGIAECGRIRGEAKKALGTILPGLAAVIVLLSAPRVDSKRVTAWEAHQAGVRYDRLEAPHAAALQYRAALATDSTLGESWHNLAATEVREGRIADGIRDYESALKFLGEHPVTLYNLATLYGRLGMDRKAIDLLDRSLASDPGQAAARVDRGVALYRLGRTAEAVEEWRRVARIAPEEPTLRQTLIRLKNLDVGLPPDLDRIATP